MPVNITFRTQLIGGVALFCQDSGLALLRDVLNLVGLIVSLARYKEEGVRLNPQVYISNDIGSLMAMLPDGETIKIGSTTLDQKGIKEAIKKTAPLATDGWCVYLQDRESLEFGVFRGSGNPLSVAIDDILLERIEPLVVVKAFSVAEECVEIRASNGTNHLVFLDHREEDAPPPLQYLDSLVASIASGCAEETREALCSFLKKVLFTALQDSHGCIIAVTDKKKPPAFVARDAIVLECPIDFCDLVGKHRKGATDWTMLTKKSALLKGMLSSAREVP